MKLKKSSSVYELDVREGKAVLKKLKQKRKKKWINKKE